MGHSALIPETNSINDQSEKPHQLYIHSSFPNLGNRINLPLRKAPRGTTCHIDVYRKHTEINLPSDSLTSTNLDLSGDPRFPSARENEKQHHRVMASKIGQTHFTQV